MPFYYDLERDCTSNGSANTDSTHLWVATASQQATLFINQLTGSCRFGTAGGAQLFLKTGSGTTASGGTTQTAKPKNPNSPAAASVWKNDATAITANTTLTTRVTVGLAQTGGMGGWIAPEPDAAIQLLANGGTNGNAEFHSECNAASVPMSITVDFYER